MILLDTHVLVWTRASSSRLSLQAREAVTAADRLAICDITLWEIGMLVRKGRLVLDGPVRGYLEDVARDVEVLPITPRIAAAVAGLPDAFPARDPADRIIYATAGAHELALVSADEKLREWDPTVIW